jgi:glycosyltransferase involved in cell wall biosynthesis
MAHKVLQVIASLRTGGAQSLLVYTLEQLRMQGRYEFVVATVLPGGLFAPALEAIDVPVYSLDATAPWDVRVIPRLRRVMQRVQPDIVHCHLFWADVYATLANRTGRRTPLVYTEHSVSNSRRSIPVFRLWDRVVMNQFDRIVAVGEEARTSLVQWAGIDPTRTVVIPNGLNPDRFPSTADRDDVRRALGIAGDEFVIICVARLMEAKGLDRLLVAAKTLAGEGQRFRLLIVGDGPLRRDLERDCERLMLRDVVQFLGTRSDVADLLVASDMFVLSSLWEGLPIALLEAMGSRLPVVATCVGAVGQVIREGVDGYVVPPNDAPALATAIAAVMDLTPMERAEMGRRARERVVSEYSLSSLAHRLLDVYDEVLRDQNR